MHTSRKSDFYDCVYDCILSRAGHLRLLQCFRISSCSGRLLKDITVVKDKDDVFRPSAEVVLHQRQYQPWQVTCPAVLTHRVQSAALAGGSVLRGIDDADWDAF